MKKLFGWAFCAEAENNDKKSELDSERSPPKKEKKNNQSYGKNDHAHKLKHEILKSVQSSHHDSYRRESHQQHHHHEEEKIPQRFNGINFDKE
jgi:hypothetical protein